MTTTVDAVDSRCATLEGQVQQLTTDFPRIATLLDTGQQPGVMVPTVPPYVQVVTEVERLAQVSLETRTKIEQAVAALDTQTQENAKIFGEALQTAQLEVGKGLAQAAAERDVLRSIIAEGEGQMKALMGNLEAGLSNQQAQLLEAS